MPKRYVAYKEVVLMHGIDAINRSSYADRPDLSADYRLELVVYLTSYSGDWDNIGGTISDALQGQFWDNDGQIVSGQVHKIINKKEKNCRVEITIEELNYS